MNWDRLLDEQAIAALLPIEYAHFSKPVCEGLAVFLHGLPAQRQTEILASQAALGPQAEVSERLGVLARSCPVLQKIGQVLARDQRLSPELRQHLRELESLPPSVPWPVIEAMLDEEFGDLARLGITLTPPALAEASVAVVVPFVRKQGVAEAHGVFKILKPGIEGILAEELGLLEQVGTHLDQRCDELQIPHLDYEEAFQQVRGKLTEEICLDHEQRALAEAQQFYADIDCVQIPKLMDLCTSRVTSMERVWGEKVTEHRFTTASDRYRLAEMIVDGMISQPIFSRQQQAMFHSDPHAGNLFLTTDGRLAILDWSLVGRLGEAERIGIVQLLLGALLQDEQRVLAVLRGLSQRGKPESRQLLTTIGSGLRKLRDGQFPGIFWLSGMLDEAVSEGGLRFSADLMMFRKSLYTLEGVVAEVGVRSAIFDQVLIRQFLQHFMVEWPSRWFSLPGSREFNTRLSNWDLAETVLSLPSSITRYWLRQGVDWLEKHRDCIKA